MILLLALACRPAAEPQVAMESPVAPAVAPLVLTARRPGEEGPRFQLGVNEGVAVPARLRVQMSPAERDAALAADRALLEGLGARWVRGHTGSFPMVSCGDLAKRPGQRAEMDAWVTAVGTSLQAIGMVSPWPGNATANHTESYVPADLEAYGACVTALVERYDGDGVDDMPGLPRPVKVWEVDNEPDLKNSVEARGATRKYDPKTFATPAEYAKVLVATGAAIRKADPEALVLGLGLYRPHAEQGQTYARGVLAEAGAREAFDVLSLHTYHDDDGDRLAGGIRALRALVPDKPVWITEASVGAERMGEDEQARRVVAQVANAAAAGAERFLWHSLMDPPPSPDSGPRRQGGGFATHSLFQAVDGAEPREKPSGRVYRHLAALLAREELAGCVAEGAGVVRLSNGSRLLFAGSLPAPQGGINLRTGEALGETAVAPAWLAP